MRRYPLAIAISIVFLSVFVASQDSAHPQPDDSLRAAPAPPRYEPPSPTATSSELEASGDQLRAEKAYGDAIDYYRAALAKTRAKPAQAQLCNKAGIAELQMMHFRDAEKDFERSIKRQHAYAEAHNNLGATYYLEKKYAKAIEEYQQALQLQDNDASFHNNLATAYFMLKEYPQAMSEYRRAFQIDPMVFDHSSQTGVSARLSTPGNRAMFSYWMAKIYAQTGDFDRSILYLRRAMEDGYKEIDNVYKDQEFSSLRKDPRFTELMAAKPVAIPE
ncbi:MAG: tetratricopeptide repeat protein [Terriglobales bacterium]